MPPMFRHANQKLTEMISKKVVTRLNLFSIMERFPTKLDALRHFERIRWEAFPVCTKCGYDSRITLQKKHPSRYRRSECRSYFTALTETPLEYNKVDPRKWIYASYLLMATLKRISSLQLSKEIDVSQATAWYMLHRLRLACGNGMDTAYIGRNTRRGKEMVGKTITCTHTA